MKKRKYYLTLWVTAAAAVFAAATLTAATYAWFSANRKVETETVTARTGTADLELQISRQDGDDFSPETIKDEDGVAYNQVDLEPLGSRVLMPVSTADLKTFLYSPSTAEGEATENTLVVPSQQELADIIYHDTIYLRLWDNGTLSDNATVNLYLDDPGIEQSDAQQASESPLLSAARLGLVIGDTFLILRYSEDEKNAESNTLLNGQRLAPGQVLTQENNIVKATDIPAEHQGLLSEFQYSESNLTPRPILVGMEPGTIYPLDIYFYLEGCDPDCGDTAQKQQAGLGLAFYEALT